MYELPTCCLSSQRNGADHAVFINTGMAFEGSDAGASPNEAITWGKIKLTAQPVKVPALTVALIDSI